MAHLSSSLAIPAVVVGACGHGMAVAKGLALGGVAPIVLESNPALPGVLAGHGRMLLVPRLSGEHLVDELLALAKRERFAERPVLMLTNDRMVATVCQQAERLLRDYRISFAPGRARVLEFLTKSALERRCAEVGLNYPRTFVMQHAADAERAAADVGFPMIVKPARPLASFKTARPANLAALLALVADHGNALPFLVQRFVDGPESATQFCALYLGPGGEIARFTGRKLRSRPLGHTTVAEGFQNEVVWQAARRFFDGTGITGPVSLEVKLDPQGEPWVIEPTVGRTDFWAGLCVANGVNLPWIEYAEQAGLPVPAVTQSNQAVWFNEERDPYGRAWFALRSGHRLGPRDAAYLYLDDARLAVRKRAMRQIAATVWRDARSWTGKRVGHLFGRPEGAASVDEKRWQLDCYDDIDALPPPVIALMQQAETHDLQSGPDWYRNLSRNVPPLGQRARWHVISEGGSPKIVLPLQVHDAVPGQGRQISALANYYTALYAPVLAHGADKADMTRLLRHVLACHGPVSRLQFAPMDPDDTRFHLLQDGLKQAGLRVMPYFCFGNWHLPVRMSWPDYLASRSGELRSTLQRMGRRFERLGGQLSIVQGGPAVQQATEAYAKVYAQSWKRPEPYPEFIPGLIDTCVKRGWLRLGLAMLDGEPVAAQLWIVTNGRAHIFKLAHSEQHKNCSPGSLLTAHLMQHVMEVDRVTDIDYMTGDDAYKVKWMSQRDERVGLSAYNLHHPVGLAGYLRDCMGRRWREWQEPPARTTERSL